MVRLLKRVILIAAITAFFAGEPFAVAGNPVGDFFKRLGNSLAHPKNTPAPKRDSQKRATGKKDVNGQTAPQDLPPAPPVVSPVPIPTPTPMPIPMMVRSAGEVPANKKPRRDLPYGIPVPNKPGFVTSPYSPKSGYVDVRGFASDTEVKDPYSGKVFLTP